MDYVVRYFAENTDYKELKKKIGKRQVAVWGAYVSGKQLKNVLADEGISVDFYIDGHKADKEYDNLPIVNPEIGINGGGTYIFIAVVGVRDEIVRYLNKWQMEEGMDYTYISKMLPRVTILECTGGKYSDCFGNSLECADENIKCRIEFVGFENKVKIGRGVDTSEQTHITAEGGCEIVIGNNVRLIGKIELEALGGGLKIGDSCCLMSDSRISSKGAEINLGNYVTTGERFFCSNGKSSIINIGNDCMFSHDVSIISGGHSIFDLEKKENVSMKREKYIKIGNHVWLGKNAVVLHNADIGTGCIVGASSVVKLQTEKNCVIAGNPAKIIKQNHTWDRRRNLCFEDL